MDTSNLLKRIVSRSRHNLAILKANCIQPCSGSSQTRLSLALPEPEPIVDRLLSSGCSRTNAEHLSGLYLQHAMQLKRDYEKNMKKAVEGYEEAGLVTEIGMEIQHIYRKHEDVYQRDLAQWVNAIVHRVEERIRFVVSSQSEVSFGHTQGKRILSKQDAAFLEEEFSKNAYPTRSEKEKIADAVGVDYKQIHVWFQNKRSRSRRQGKDLRKLAFVLDERSPACYENVEARLMFTATQAPLPEKAVRPTSPRQSPCPFYIDRPVYAFPTIFTPLSEHRPFARKRTFDVPWFRHTAVERCGERVEKALTDIDQLCVPLSQLNLTDERYPVQTPSLMASNQRAILREQAAVCFPILIHPPTAPLPALMPTTVTVRASKGSPFQTSLSEHAVYVPTPLNTPIKLPSAKHSRFTLTRHAPESLLKPVRDSTHPYQARSCSRMKPQLARLSRLSSTSSLYSTASDDVCSSRASSASLESPPPLTPPQLPLALPQFVKVFVPDVVFSPSQDLDRLFGDTDLSKHTLLTHPQIQVAQ